LAGVFVLGQNVSRRLPATPSNLKMTAVEALEKGKPMAIDATGGQEGMKEIRMSAPRKIVEHFLSNLKAKSNRKRFGFDLKLIKRDLRLYRFDDHHKPFFLFIHESLGSFWEISSHWQEIRHFLPSENAKWAVILLQKPREEDSPLGFLISNDDFVLATSGSSINRMGRIKIHKRGLSLRHHFDNWDGFFELLKL
jgi:hypothetical protein